MPSKPSLISTGLGLIALTLTSVVIGRVSANAGSAPADFTPVIISPVAGSAPTPSPTSNPMPRSASSPTPKQAPAMAPTQKVTTEPITQIKPIPRDISDDAGDDHGGEGDNSGNYDRRDHDIGGSDHLEDN